MPAGAPRTTQVQSGQAALPVALLALALLVSVGLVARWGQAAVASSRAQAVADAVALATLVAADRHAIAHGVLPDDAAASAAALDAGGELASFELHAGNGTVEVEVIVELDGQRAAAAATAPLPLVDAATGAPAG
jgi:hypothetical protein